MKSNGKHKCGAGDPNTLLYLSPQLADDQLSLQIRNLKKQLRSVMNGVASSSMKSRGADYKVNYGVPFVIIKEIASKVAPNHDLAQLLWAENVRELNIIATLLQPRETFTTALANQWVNRITNPEQAEQICLNLLQHCAFADELVIDWLKSDAELVRYTAWHLLARISRKKLSWTENQLDFIIGEAISALQSDSLRLFTSALLALKRLGAVKKNYSENILNKIEESVFINISVKLQIIEDLRFEFEYYLDSSL